MTHRSLTRDIDAAAPDRPARKDMYELRPSDIALPPTVSIDVSHLVAAALEAASSTEHEHEEERAA